jgi:putative nucleotidyltransferase with HDIG domain
MGSVTRLRPDAARVAILLAALAPAGLVALVGGRMFMPAAIVHFGVVAAAAAIAGTASVALTVAGVRAGDGRAMLLGTAFSTMTALFGVHGLLTPGVLVGPNGVMVLAGGLSMPVGAGLLALTALPALRRPARIVPLLILQATLAIGVVALAALALIDPTLVPVVPRTRSGLALVALVFSYACLAVLGARGLRTYALTRRRSDALVVVGCGWLAIALWGTLMIAPMSLGFYLAHALELSAIALIGLPAVFDLRRGGASRPLVGDLTGPDLVAAEEAYLGPRVRALLVRLAEQDGSTADHSRRVALLAAQVAEVLRLPAAARRRLAIGGLLHDIGKLGVPRAILRKPGALDDAEYAVVKTHPAAGARLLDELGGFGAGVRRLVRDHHERLDGAGYPSGLPGAALDLETRILTACDVFDALVSDRVYRAAWDTERALGLLREESGTAFDPQVVAALERVVAGDAPGWVAGLAAPAHARPAPPGAARAPRPTS